MFDTFDPLKGLKKQDFNFQPTRYETWMDGTMVSSGKTNSVILAKVIHEGSFEKVEVTFIDQKLNNEIAQKNTFDVFITGKDRLQLLIIPEETNIENMAIRMFKMTIGATRKTKSFSKSEPFCCNLFLQNGILSKVTFSFSNPEKLIEFYQDVSNSFKSHEQHLHSGHEKIISFFKQHKFGTNNAIMTFFSVLATTDRCVVLEQLYNPNNLDSILSDKLLLAYVSSGKHDLANKVIENSIKNGESDTNVWGLQSKLDLGLAPKRNRAQRIEIYTDFLSKTNTPIEVQFLNILIEFCNNYYE